MATVTSVLLANLPVQRLTENAGTCENGVSSIIVDGLARAQALLSMSIFPMKMNGCAEKGRCGEADCTPKADSARALTIAAQRCAGVGCNA